MNAGKEGGIEAGHIFRIDVADHCLVTIRRPSGAVKTLRHPKIREMSAGLLQQVNTAMAQANRGEVIRYENVRRAATYTVTAADAATDSTERIERLMRAGDEA